jgi:hypothetical protein
MWEPRRLTTVWASTASYTDSFTHTTHIHNAFPPSLSCLLEVYLTALSVNQITLGECLQEVIINFFLE